MKDNQNNKNLREFMLEQKERLVQFYVQFSLVVELLELIDNLSIHISPSQFKEEIF
jgi:hypothetical protein